MLAQNLRHQKGQTDERILANALGRWVTFVRVAASYGSKRT